MAPEVLSGKNTTADPAIDIYSLGVILFSLVVGYLPFEGDDVEIKQNKINGIFEFPKNMKLSREICDLIKSMLQVNPKERIKMKHIFLHPWVIGKIRNKVDSKIDLISTDGDH